MLKQSVVSHLYLHPGERNECKIPTFLAVRTLQRLVGGLRTHMCSCNALAVTAKYRDSHLKGFDFEWYSRMLDSLCSGVGMLIWS